MSDSMFSAAFDVLIKISESYRPQIPSIFAVKTVNEELKYNVGAVFEEREEMRARMKKLEHDYKTLKNFKAIVPTTPITWSNIERP